MWEICQIFFLRVTMNQLRRICINEKNVIFLAPIFDFERQESDL